MSIFQTNNNTLFDLAKWEQRFHTRDIGPAPESILEAAPADGNQFVLLQLSDGAQRVINTSQVVPTLKGDQKPDINMLLDFEGFKIGTDEDIDPRTKATLQLQVGQEKAMDGLEKLFYCINGGLDLYNDIKKKNADANEFKKTTAEALGKKPISLPAGTGQISLKVVKHEEPKWWQRIFQFATGNTGRELMSLIGFAGVTETAVNCLSGMLDNLFDKQPQVLFQSQPIRLAFTQAAKEELSGGLATNLVSSLNPGFWVMVRKNDYQTIADAKPIYYGGLGLLAPDGMSEVEANSSNNPFSRLTYAVIRARMKEIDLKDAIL